MIIFFCVVRSSVKYNIPARTLRDWMKRMNIKSVFTHNNGTGSVKSDSGSLDSRNPSMESNDAHSVVSNGELSTSPDLQLQVCNSFFRTLDSRHFKYILWDFL